MSTRRVARRGVRIGALLVALAGPAPGGPLAGQEPPRISVRVRQVAGATIYLDVGRLHGLETGDTLGVMRDSLAAPVGRLVVTAAADERSVLTFEGEPFPVARGEVLTLLLRRAGAEPPPAPLPTPLPPPPTPERRPPSTTPVSASPAGPSPAALRPRGSVTFGLSATRSSTRFGGAAPVSVPRTYATPSLRFDLTVPEAAAGFTLRLSTRLAYRYSSVDGSPPATSVRVYAAALERTFTAAPVRMALGRFHSPAETYSGFWDGLFVRLGGRGVGVGALVGFEPDRWNERPSTELPKATVFLDAAARGRSWSWSADVSAHTVRPADSLATRTFFGASQRLRAGSVVLAHDLQLDRDPNGGGARVSRLRLRSSLDLGGGVQIRAAASRRESFVMSRPDDPFGLRSDRLTVGGLVHSAGGFLSVDGGLTRDAFDQESVGATASFVRDRLPGLGAGGGASVSHWSGPYGSSLSVAPALHFAFDRARLRVGYRLHRSDYLDRILTTHGMDGSLDMPFLQDLHFSARGRMQWGSTLRSGTVDLSLRRVF